VQRRSARARQPPDKPCRRNRGATADHRPPTADRYTDCGAHGHPYRHADSLAHSCSSYPDH
jgi:hypothetical protein